ncbi:class I SAM-dependent methyltransferase [Sphingorhabdus sp. SMR4y]|uniref:class I SAM-dependent methyltransferase n=1 Tax=Sphingorhabdus sp. SMR4y TaxID=2584094 RepID=UPI000B5CA50F|nr:class I SAM-dependent methyltransferase [Sphingorhabdus sp. SMR4y]ASK88899.1 ubiquinone/menaquinone biosynthesis methyltransferase [Sphingorhabdus sp. SMR4y]
MSKDSSPSGQQPEELKQEDWAGEMGLKWLASLSLFEEMIAPIGEALLARAGYQDGETVIDLGCGGGATTLAIADAVAPSGKVMGLDISPDLIAAAQERADKSGAGNIAFTCADAATVQLPDAPYDRLFSRFGSMFFADPVGAFTNLHGLVRKGGRIDLAVWGPPRDNLWMMEMMGVVRNHIEIPPAVPRAPGPFAFEDLEYLGEILDASGFTNVDIAAYEALQPVGGIGATPQKAVEFAFASMAVGRALADKGEAVIDAASKELASVFARHHVPGEGVMMQGKVWLVSATA